MYAYFHKTELDEQFYERHLRHRLPGVIVDAHAHFNRPEHVARITPETIAGDWALECGLIMTAEDARAYTAVMFPDKEWRFVSLPWPLREADTHGNNAYVSSLVREQGQPGLYTLRPEYDTARIEQEFTAGGFSGFKPYPYMASATKGADVSIFDFMTHEQFALANRLKAAVLLHLPRAGRLPDPENVAEIRTILDRYPDLRLVVAHFGRCFQHEHFEQGLERLGDDVHRLWFDCSAVLNPKVHQLAFAHLDHHRVLYGTDLPIFLWHGKREWDARGYHNLCREDFSWNRHPHPEDEPQYTYYIYEQMKNILDIIGDRPESVEAVFRRNAEAVYGSAETVRQSAEAIYRKAAPAPAQPESMDTQMGRP